VLIPLDTTMLAAQPVIGYSHYHWATNENNGPSILGHQIASWEIVPVEDFPLYIGYPFVWPALGRLLQGEPSIHDMPYNTPILLNGRILVTLCHIKNDDVCFNLLAINRTMDIKKRGKAKASISKIKSWKIIPTEDLPLYIGWKATWPLLSQMIKDA